MKKLYRNILFSVTIIGLIIYFIFEMILFSISAYNTQSEVNSLYRNSIAIQNQIESIFQSTITISDGYLSFMTSNLEATKDEVIDFINNFNYSKYSK